MNVFCGTGRLVADPTERKVGDYKVANFTIAIDREFSKDDKTDFLDCEAWGKTAEFLLNYLKKGNLVAVVGRVLKDSWEKDGEKRYKTYISVDRIQSLGSKSDSAKDDNLDDGEIKMSEIPF